MAVARQFTIDGGRVPPPNGRGMVVVS
jgi:hypothetical protein